MSIKIIESCGNIEERWTASPNPALCPKSSDNVCPDQKSITLTETRHSGDENSIPSHILSSSTFATKILFAFDAVFLPEGIYSNPSSVTTDYLRYQLFDTLQALCSSITGTLSTRAVLKGTGVGDATATVISGTVNWLIRDGTGMLGRIVFASYVSSDLDYDAKRWRLAADITNDFGLILNILSEHVPQEYFLTMTCLGSLFFAITAAAGGATRNSLTAHFALNHNTADVSAKDGSQETAVSFIGMFLGLFVATFVPTSFYWTFSTVVFFVAMHLLTNYLGVKSLILEHLNENRLVICLQHFISCKEKEKENNETSNKKVEAKAVKVPTPEEMRELEGVVFKGPRIQPITLGACLRETILSLLKSKKSQGMSASSLTKQAVESLATKKYFVADCMETLCSFQVVLAEEATHLDVLRGYLECLKKVKEIDVDEFLKVLQECDWKVDRFQLRTYDWRVNMKKQN